MTRDSHETVDVLLEKIKLANSALEDAELHTASARSNEIAALNRLNELQKKLEDEFAKLKLGAPTSSDWARNRK